MDFDDEDDSVDLPHVTYHKMSDGRWFKQEWPHQCDHGAWVLGGKCQGVRGHTGEHWCYRSEGSYAYRDNEADVASKRDKRGVSGMIPPGHKDYVNPETKTGDFYINHSTTVEVTDVNKIAELEQDKCEDGASIDKPCSPEEIKWLRDNGRLDGLGLDDDEDMGDE